MVEWIFPTTILFFLGQWTCSFHIIKKWMKAHFGGTDRVCGLLLLYYIKDVWTWGVYEEEDVNNLVENRNKWMATLSPRFLRAVLFMSMTQGLVGYKNPASPFISCVKNCSTVSKMINLEKHVSSLGKMLQRRLCKLWLTGILSPGNFQKNKNNQTRNIYYLAEQHVNIWYIPWSPVWGNVGSLDVVRMPWSWTHSLNISDFRADCCYDLLVYLASFWDPSFKSNFVAVKTVKR